MDTIKSLPVECYFVHVSRILSCSMRLGHGVNSNDKGHCACCSYDAGSNAVRTRQSCIPFVPIMLSLRAHYTIQPRLVRASIIQSHPLADGFSFAHSSSVIKLLFAVVPQIASSNAISLFGGDASQMLGNFSSFSAGHITP